MLSCFRIRYGSSTTGRLRDGTPLRDTNIRRCACTARARRTSRQNCSASLAQGLEAILGGLADRRARPELAGLTEDRLGFLPPLLGHQDQTQVVVGELHLGIELVCLL